MTNLAQTLRAQTLRILPFAFAAVTLAACGSDAEQPANDADSFAARIGKGEASPTPGQQGAIAPAVATPLPGAAPGPYMPGTQTDPAAKTCGAPLMGRFIGKVADQATRAEIAKTLGRTDNLRFVAFGSAGYINPDPTNPRLSLMLDGQNIIRDARCG